MAYLDLNSIKAFKKLKAKIFKFNSDHKDAQVAKDKEIDWYPKITTLLLKKLPFNLHIIRRKLYEGF